MITCDFPSALYLGIKNCNKSTNLDNKQRASGKISSCLVRLNFLQSLLFEFTRVYMLKNGWMVNKFTRGNRYYVTEGDIRAFKLGKG